MPFGGFDGVLGGCEALVIPAPGEAPALVQTPPAPAVPDAHAVRLRVVLAQDGGAELEGALTWSGASASELRDALEPADALQRRQGFERLLSRQFPGLVVEDLAAVAEDEPEQPFEIRWKGRAPGVARPSADGGLEIDAPLFPFMLTATYGQVGTRQLPLLVEREPVAQRIEVVAPAGLELAASSPRQVETPYGRYRRVEKVTGQALVREEQLELSRSRIPPERYPAFAGFAASIDSLQQEPVRLTR
ncbi:MAG: hypothetical protein QM767_22455 [Anaeromyxobacter sp.]